MEEKENSNPPPFFYSRLHAEKNGPPSCDQHEDDSVEKKRSNLIDMVDKHLAIENSQHCQKKKKKNEVFHHTHTHTQKAIPVMAGLFFLGRLNFSIRCCLLLS